MWFIQKFLLSESPFSCLYLFRRHLTQRWLTYDSNIFKCFFRLRTYRFGVRNLYASARQLSNVQLSQPNLATWKCSQLPVTRYAKSGSYWTSDELEAYNIIFVDQTKLQFFGSKTLSAPTRRSKDFCLFFGILSRALLHCGAELGCDSDFVENGIRPNHCDCGKCNGGERSFPFQVVIIIVYCKSSNSLSWASAMIWFSGSLLLFNLLFSCNSRSIPSSSVTQILVCAAWGTSQMMSILLRNCQLLSLGWPSDLMPDREDVVISSFHHLSRFLDFLFS